MNIQIKKKAIIEKDLLVTLEGREKEGPPMMTIETPIKEKEALPMMTKDIEEKGVTLEIEETTMEAAGLEGEETAGRVSVSELFCRRLSSTETL